jgi:hypothetical protein
LDQVLGKVLKQSELPNIFNSTLLLSSISFTLQLASLYFKGLFQCPILVNESLELKLITDLYQFIKIHFFIYSYMHTMFGPLFSPTPHPLPLPIKILKDIHTLSRLGKICAGV